MSQLAWMLVALVLFLASLPLLSLGTDTDTPAVWWIGLVMVGLAGVVPPLLRFTPLAQEGDGEDGGEEEDGGEGAGGSSG